MKYLLKLKRRHTFYTLNLFSPVLILAYLNAMVFVLPAESGERVGYAITCLLSLSVYMTFASESLPNSSKPLPIITFVLLAYIVISTLISVCTVIGLNFHLRISSCPPPKIVNYCLCCSRKTKDVERSGAETNEKLEVNYRKCCWKDVAKQFDRLCFIVSNSCISLLTFLYFVIVRNGNEN